MKKQAEAENNPTIVGLFSASACFQEKNQLQYDFSKEGVKIAIIPTRGGIFYQAIDIIGTKILKNRQRCNSLENISKALNGNSQKNQDDAKKHPKVKGQESPQG